LQNQQVTNQRYRLPEPTDSWSSITTQPLSLELRAQQGAQILHNEMILQENRASKECRIHMYQGAQNKAPTYLMDGMLMKMILFLLYSVHTWSWNRYYIGTCGFRRL
ncbi:MAG: hypothetical protein EZS28_038449, partial [Streblomastix strix]